MRRLGTSRPSSRAHTRAGSTVMRGAARLAVAVLIGAGLVALDASVANAAANATVMARTQRMSGPALTTTQSGWYEAGTTISLVCHQRGQAVKGHYSPWIPNGGWDNLWYLVSDGYFAADVDLNTGTNDPVVSECPIAFSAAPTPTITGAVRVGSTVSVAPGAWSPGANLAYQWKVGGAAVAGATSSSWVVSPSAHGAAVTVTVTGSRTGYATTSRTSAGAAVAAGALTGSTAKISGTPTIGKKLTAQAGAWGPAPVTLTYQWLRNGKAITGATKATYTSLSSDVGKKISVRVTGSKKAYATAVSTSAAKTIGKALSATPTPTVSGTARVGQKLTAKAGTWKPATVTLKYQWQRAGAPIGGATAATYKLTTADAGKAVSVRVTGAKSGYTSVARTSAVKNVEKLLTTATPTIAGTKTVGQKLTAAPGAWGPAPVTLKYQWLRAGAAISGATAATYTLVSADAGKAVSVRVTGSKSGFTTSSKTSAAVTVGKALTATPLPTISGTATEGQKLTAQPGTWAPAPVSLTYQWYRGTAAIAGATAATYTLVAADVGQSITVRVKGSKSGYTAVTKTSAAVTPVGLVITASTPTISGSASAKSTLTAEPGAWSPAPVTFSYQWYVDGGAVAGATGKTWTVPVWAATRVVTVKVTGARAGYASVSRTSGGVAISGTIHSSVGPGSSMPPNSSLLSANGKYRFVVQSDGNLVVYSGSAALWSSKTNGQSLRELAVQTDGNLVGYRTNGTAFWASNTAGKVLRELIMQDDGNLVLYATSGAAVWATNTTQGGGGGGGSVPGVNGWAYPIRPHATLTTYSGHNGDDFPVATGTPVYAMGAGTVTFSTYDVTAAWCPVPGAVGGKQTDLRVTTNRDGKTYLITYAHLSSYSVSSGQTVQAGQLIGYSGAKGCATGPHLHVDIKVNGVAKTLFPHNLFGWSY